MVALQDVVDVQLSEVVGVGPREHLLHVAQVRHHRDNVVLDVAQIQSNVSARSDGILLVASFGESLDNIGLATKEAHHVEHALAALANQAEQCNVIVISNDEHLVFDALGLVLSLADDGLEGIDNVIDHGVADVVRGDGHNIACFPNTLANVDSVGVVGEAEAEHTFGADDDVDMDRVEEVFA